jgi:hypothetical protein
MDELTSPTFNASKRSTQQTASQDISPMTVIDPKKVATSQSLKFSVLNLNDHQQKPYITALQ